MENCQLILNSNSLCVICLSEVEAKVDKADLFRLHHLTSKINSSLGSVFKDVTVPWAPNAVMDRLEVLADVCEGCRDLSEDLLYNFQDDVGRANCIQSILDKMEGVGLENKYLNCGSPLAVFYAGIVDRLRKEIVEKLRKKLKSGQSGTGTSASLDGIPSLVNIPDLPITQIFSYLPLEDMINCSTVSKDVRRLIFPSLINSSLITLKHRDQITALIDFIKDITNDVKAGVSLFIDFYDDGEDEDGLDRQDNLLKVFQKCGPIISHLKLRFAMMDGDSMFGFPNYTSIPVCCGNEMLPNLKRLELDYWAVYCKTASDDFNLFLPLIKAILGNSPNLKELKLICDFEYEETEDFITPKLLKLIGESRLPITTLGIDGSVINGSEMGYLQPLNLEKVVIDVFFELTDVQTWTQFLESQSSTLKYFRLEAQGTSHFTFPRMESLETFELISAGGEEPEGGVGSIFSQSQLPKLNRLLVQRRNVDGLPTLFPSDAKSTANVKELRLLLPALDKGVLIRTTGLFQSLSKLEIPVAPYLNEVWKDLSGLEELTLLQNETGAGDEKPIWIDDIITGLAINRDNLSAITEEDIREFEEAHEKIKTEKSMAPLTRLRLLRLRQGRKYYLGRLMLSDISCRLVLMKMESLKCIDFSGIHPSFVGASEKVLAKMGNKMELYFGEKRDWYYKSLRKNQKKTTWSSFGY